MGIGLNMAIFLSYHLREKESSMCGHKGKLKFLLALVALLYTAQAAQAWVLGENHFKPGDKAPDFVTKDLAGREVQLSAFAGKKVVLLLFWGLNNPCLDEMDYLEIIGSRYADKGLVILGINDYGADTETIIKDLAASEMRISYPVLIDEDSKISDEYINNFLDPLTVLVDKSGMIEYIMTGFDEALAKEIEDAVRKALRL